MKNSYSQGYCYCFTCLANKGQNDTQTLLEYFENKYQYDSSDYSDGVRAAIFDYFKIKQNLLNEKKYLILFLKRE